MQSPYTSHVLYHLVGSSAPDDDEANYRTLCAVLSSMELRTNEVAGQRNRILLEIDPERGDVDGEPIAQSKVCLCDIPFQALGLHTKRYGRFGVGVDRATVAKWGGRPVIYVPTTQDPRPGTNDYLAQDAMNALVGLDKFFPDPDEQRSRNPGLPPSSREEAIELARRTIEMLLAHTKQFKVNLPIEHPENFYMEREWCKLGKLSLHSSLREIIAPSPYHEQLEEAFPALKDLRFREAPID